MTAERERDFERICRAALERRVGECASSLVDACGDNADLRLAAERLVVQQEAAASSASAAPRGDRQPSDRLARHRPLDGANFAPGQIFAARHRIVRLLGRGAMRELYRAEDLKLGQPVALKLVASKDARDDEHVQRSLAEARLPCGIAHPNVCRVYDIGAADGWCYTHAWRSQP